MDYHGRALLRLLVGGYVLYLAGELVYNQFQGGSTMPTALAIVFAAILGLGGGAVCLLSIREYRKKKAQSQEKQEDEGTETAV